MLALALKNEHPILVEIYAHSGEFFFFDGMETTFKTNFRISLQWKWDFLANLFVYVNSEKSLIYYNK